MASITTFSRLEPQPRRGDITVGASAPVRDPMWLLARQWQVGEFAGHDGGNPIVARWRGVAAAPTRFVAGPIPPDTELDAPRFDCRRRSAGIGHRAGHRAAADRRPTPPPGSASPSTPAGISSRCSASRSRAATTVPISSPVTLWRCRPTSSSRRSTRPPPPSPVCTPAAAWTAGGCGPNSQVATCPGSTAPSSRGDIAEVRQAGAAWLAWLATLFDDADRRRRAGSRPASSTPPRWAAGARRTLSARPR